MSDQTGWRSASAAPQTSEEATSHPATNRGGFVRCRGWALEIVAPALGADPEVYSNHPMTRHGAVRMLAADLVGVE